jgi:TolB protein
VTQVVSGYRRGSSVIRALLLFVGLAAVLPLAVDRATAGDTPRLVRLTSDRHFKQRPAWSPDGKRLLFSRHRAGRISLVATLADGTNEIVLSTEKFPQYDGCWSPDGERIAFTHVPHSGPQGNLDVYLSKGDGTELVKLAGDHQKLSHEESPAWSPDGRQIAFSSTYEGNQELYVIGTDGQSHTRLTSDPAFDAHPGWSPDSKQIAFATNRWGDFEIAVTSRDGSEITRLTESDGLDDYPAFSPDGRRLAFLSNRDGNYEIYVMEIDGRRMHNVSQSPALDHFPAWTPDGRLTFVSNRDGGFEIYVTERAPFTDN